MSAQPVQPAAAPAPFQSASLYVGDLNNEATEGILFELFNRVGPVASIRVCRDAVTRRSLGYAYVNFHNVQDAERALDTMNFTEIKNRPCRIMWSQRDPSLRKSGVGNIFIKNLPTSIDNKGIFDIFSVFGNILSCKVATDENGVSKGYGYVHYETGEAATDATAKINGNTIDDQEVTVGLFVRRQERAGQSDWTNLYAKQFPESWDDEKLKALFSTFGPVASVIITRDETGKSKRFGFVNFSDHESAEKALNELNGKTLPDDEAAGTTFELYVNKAQKKSERSREINHRLATLNQERASKYQGMNLYVKNLDDTITDEFFRETFSAFGTITSSRIMKDPSDPVASKGFGFVCYSSPEEATRAVTEMNGKILRSKPIVVTLHQRKDLRRAHLAATYAPRNMRFPPNGSGGMPMPYMGGMYMPQQQQQGFPQRNQFGFPQAPFPQGGPQGGRGSPRGIPQQAPFNAGGRGGQQGGYAMPYNGNMYPMQGMQGQGSMGPRRVGPNGQPMPMTPGGPNMMMAGRGSAVPGRGMPNPAMQGRGMPNPAMQQGGRGAPMNPQQMAMQRNGIKFNNQVRNQMPPHMMQQPMPGMDGPLDDQALAQADPAQQKNMIGERLYPLIFVHQPQLAGKITGMLLEMDNAELLNLIESPDALTHKIDEALTVLKQHSQQDAQAAERQ